MGIATTACSSPAPVTKEAEAKKAPPKPAEPISGKKAFYNTYAVARMWSSDVMPIKPWGRAIVMIEEFAGVMYIAVVVSRLIGLTVARQEKR